MIPDGGNGTRFAYIAQQRRSTFAQVAALFSFSDQRFTGFQHCWTSAQVWTIERNSNETNLEKSGH